MFCKTLALRGECLHILLMVKIIIFYLDQPCPALSIFKDIQIAVDYGWEARDASFPPCSVFHSLSPQML